MVPDYFVWAEQVYLSCIEDGVAADRSIVEPGEVLAKSHIVVLRLGHSFPVTPEDNCKSQLSPEYGIPEVNVQLSHLIDTILITTETAKLSYLHNIFN